MGDKPVFLTAMGKMKLQEELTYLREVRRREVAERIRAAKELTDTFDNPEYFEAKNEQSFVEGRIRTLERMLANAVIIEDHEDAGDIVHLGSHVTVRNEEGELEYYTIVGSAEADPLTGKISNESPVGKALLGRRPGEEVTLAVPGGIRVLSIVVTT
ncbi:MAG: transcription elongation factor GreA [Chloroflexi bacterium]|nr:transcription elongation factor GreA [Chloroflexota bacterium]MCL5076112.1 transcription elongation factor GreA [Chloroflexota bacterium]